MDAVARELRSAAPPSLQPLNGGEHLGAAAHGASMDRAIEQVHRHAAFHQETMATNARMKACSCTSCNCTVWQRRSWTQSVFQCTAGNSRTARLQALGVGQNDPLEHGA